MEYLEYNQLNKIFIKLKETTDPYFGKVSLWNKKINRKETYLCLNITLLDSLRLFQLLEELIGFYWKVIKLPIVTLQYYSYNDNELFLFFPYHLNNSLMTEISKRKQKQNPFDIKFILKFYELIKEFLETLHGYKFSYFFFHFENFYIFDDKILIKFFPYFL